MRKDRYESRRLYKWSPVSRLLIPCRLFLRFGLIRTKCGGCRDLREATRCSSVRASSPKSRGRGSTDMEAFRQSSQKGFNTRQWKPQSWVDTHSRGFVDHL